MIVVFSLNLLFVVVAKGKLTITLNFIQDSLKECVNNTLEEERGK